MARALEFKHFKDEYALIKPRLDSAIVHKELVSCNLQVLSSVVDRILCVMRRGTSEVSEQSYVDFQMGLRYGSPHKQAALIMDLICHGNRRNLNSDTYADWATEIQQVYMSLWRHRYPSVQPLLTLRTYKSALMKQDPVTKVFKQVIVLALDEIRRAAMPETVANRCIFREISKEVSEVLQLLSTLPAGGNERVPQVCIDESATAWLTTPSEGLKAHLCQQLQKLAKRAAHLSNKVSRGY